MSISKLKTFLNAAQLEVLGQATNVEELVEVLSGFQVKNPMSAGIDIGSMEHLVAVPEHLSPQPVRKYGSYTRDLKDLADWLVSLGIKSVVMESTGPYWQNLYEILESRGLEVCVVNARHAKNVSGRKTDVLDCQWLLQLHTYGLLNASFIPVSEVRTLRTYHRQRDWLVKEKVRAVQNIQNALTAMNLKIQHILSDIEGVTAQKIIRAIAQGQTDVEVLAEFHHKGLKATKEELKLSLEGHFRPEHLFSLKQALQIYDDNRGLIGDCDQQIEQQLARWPSADKALDQNSQHQEFVSRPAKIKPRKNEPHFEVKSYLQEHFGVDLTEVDGFSSNTLLTLLAEIGPNVKAWPDHNRFVSWLSLCPNPQISGGKVKGHKKLKTRNRATLAFRLAARALCNSNSYLGHYYRKISHRRGAKVAIKAVARKLAIIFYHMVKEQTPYRPQKMEAQIAKQEAKQMSRLQKEANKRGLKLVPIND